MNNEVDNYNFIEKYILDFLNDIEQCCFIMSRDLDLLWGNKYFLNDKLYLYEKERFLLIVKDFIKENISTITVEKSYNDIFIINALSYKININLIYEDNSSVYLCTIKEYTDNSLIVDRNTFAEFSRVYNQNIFAIYNSIDYIKNNIYDNEEFNEVFDNISSNCYKIVKNNINMGLYFKIKENKLKNSDKNILCVQNHLKNLVDSSNKVLENEIIKLENKSDELIYINVDVDLLYPLIFNLISNSLNSLDDKGKIKIIIEKFDNNCKIIIKDNGFGIETEKLKEICDEFNSHNNQTNTKTTIGIGLYIVKNIVDLIEGQIDITSKVNSGTQVTITIPQKNYQIKSNCTLQSNNLISDMYYNNMSDLYAFLKG